LRFRLFSFLNSKPRPYGGRKIKCAVGANKLAVFLATGYILFFYSERMFWSFLHPGDKPADFLLTWVVYGIMAWAFLLLIREISNRVVSSRVPGGSGLRLAGRMCRRGYDVRQQGQSLSSLNFFHRSSVARADFGRHRLVFAG
jgi:hypothetical protein